MAQPYVGEIRMFAGNFAPVGWLFCNGQQLSISENTVLFQLIGTTYGGDGESNFNLPNLQSRVPIHMGTGPDGVTYPISQMAGTEAETLSTQQIPAHNHAVIAASGIGSASSPGGAVLAQSPAVKMFTAASPASLMKPGILSPAGGSQPHENCQPFLCINYIISLYGIFPSPT